MPSVVVTGGAGYLGSVITSRLLFGGWTVTVFDRLAGSGESLMGFASHPKFQLVAADVRDEGLLRTACDGASAVVHLAAVVGEAACAADQANARSINEGGTRAALAAAEAAGVRRLVMISTCATTVCESGCAGRRGRAASPTGNLRGVEGAGRADGARAFGTPADLRAEARNDLRTIAQDAFRPADQRHGPRCGARRRD
jgi:nucleoside-diphosphate-sugar epimerase